jgi:DNA-binding MarR family transcriptional regulator
MEQAGLIARKRDADDERRVPIGLTHKGRNLRAEAKKVPAMLATGFAIDKEQIVDLRDRVRALVVALDGSGRSTAE